MVWRCATRRRCVPETSCGSAMCRSTTSASSIPSSRRSLRWSRTPSCSTPSFPSADRQGSAMQMPRALHVTVRRSGGGTETNVAKLVAAVPEFSWLALEDHLGSQLDMGRSGALIRALRAHDEPVVFCYGVTSHLFCQWAFERRRALVGNIRCETDFVGVKGVWKRLFGWRFRPWLSNSRKALLGARGAVIYNGIAEPGVEEPLFPSLARPTFGILASGHPKKGHRFAIELWRQLGKPGAMVFGGNLGAELQRDAEREGVLCPGHVDAGRFLRSIDLLLVPSTAEGLPTVILEAAARGVPSLATPVGGIPELIRHGENGYMMERTGWLEFLRATSAEDWRKVGERARAEVLKRYSLERMIRRFRAAAWLAARGKEISS
ncbi:glycosyltransferase [bacterium]|nr:glycosyltransferase [bacterium]